MVLRLGRDDAWAVKCLILLGLMYGIMSMVAYSVIHMKHVRPLPADARPDRFSEARALEHVRVLAHDIGNRQEGQPGLDEAARYLIKQLEMLADRAGPNFRIEVDRSVINGSFSMMFLGRSISFAYRNHVNIAMRISSPDSKDTDPSILVNGHFDSPLGSPGAGDCASCVASMLELARVLVDSNWVPPRPIIFLFNGAEELFLLGSHGFMKTHKWHTSIGAFINIEASGTGGPDLVCQSGPGSWPSLVYAQSAVYPMAHSAAQDIFPIIPGDTDYRIFSQDYGDIPGLDIIFLIGGYYYHTAYDTMERLLPGSIQARGENLFNLIKAFANSLESRNAQPGGTVETHVVEGDRATFFDYLTWFMIFYSRRKALVLHSLPIVVFLLMPLFLRSPDAGVPSYSAAFIGMIKGMLLHIIAILLAVIVPVVCSILRLLLTSHSMNWFAHPYLAFLMFAPSSIVGLLIPGYFLKHWSLFKATFSEEVLIDEAHFWGSFGYYAFLTLVYAVAGLSCGFITFFISVFMIPAWIFYQLLSKWLGHHSLKLAAGYVIPLIPCLVYSVYFGGFLVQFLVEKMGMMGSLPPPYGYFVPDIIVAAAVGLVTGWCVGPLFPIVGNWLARSIVMRFLVNFTVVALAVTSQFFPYSVAAPKRVILQHSFFTSGSNLILESSYDFSVVDSNALSFVFKHAPAAAKELEIDADFSFRNTNQSEHSTWLALFPVSLLFSGSLKFHANDDVILKHYAYVPHLTSYSPSIDYSTGSRKVFLELNLGSLEEIWVAVLNITGPLSGWSFADNSLPAPEAVSGGPPSYICRLSGRSDQNWTFWLEASSSEALRVDVAVLDQYLIDSSKQLKSLFPSWIDVTAYSSFLSSYYL